MKIVTVAEMALREMLRRRGVLVLLLALPLAFYLVRRGDYVGQSIRFLLLGIAWAVSTAALFASGTSRPIEPRLRLSGYRSHHLYLGRLAAMWTLGLSIAVPFFALVAVDHGDRVRLGAIALAMLLTVAVAAPFGLLIGAAVPRDLEGTLLLLVVVGVQMMIDPADAMTRLLPFWSSREIGTYAVDHTGSEYLTRGLAHGVLFGVLATALVAVLATIRLRRRPHVRFVTR
ncbi:hypothetical protein CA850_26790 [Micromonospora echinospora]|uniref:ABC-2 type transport system permease protein n=1 Tax=Micromonospora echinospora TaxID=1877 RepID=A0A1C4VTE8_MICEC|nr:hypothetical protein [Micromonospora echinospora]OZV76458.1 hypothetical protein CA850_26790 [Micromonospora echinospora]SCE87266.1 hypothetical protein GA0070618_1548 [Micromonospora echinospora]